MARDSLFSERILWEGGPSDVRSPPLLKWLGSIFSVASLSMLGFAIVTALALGSPPSRMLLWSVAWATLAIACFRGPIWWRSGLVYALTDFHVIVKRGRLRRTIERGSISYARIRWNTQVPGVGDLELVRAVPTGALRRTLSITLHDVKAPDRLWAQIRGAEETLSMGSGTMPLPQRLEVGERVLWTATPRASTASWRQRFTVAGALLSLVLLAASSKRVIPVFAKVHGILGPALYVTMVVAVCLSLAALAASAVVLVYRALVRPLLLRRRTRYFVTTSRVLILRGAEELSLDRGRIAYVIAAPSAGSNPSTPGDLAPPQTGLQDLFLVLDGPRARGLAVSGAFQRTDGEELVPVFSAIEDAETAHALLTAA
ncbi:MAG: hypothetical protein U0174_20390 [Polyangiaceae bacterium]